MSAEENYDDVVPRLDWLAAHLGIDREASSWTVGEGVGLLRALFNVGPLPGEARSVVAEVFPPPRATEQAARRPRFC